jgi:hypothetical protein
VAKAEKQSKVQHEVVEENPELITPQGQPNPEAALEFPSIAGEGTGDDDLSNKPEVEVAERSQDEDSATATVHRKDFVVLKAAWSEDDAPVDVDKKHVDNIEATRQYLMHQGLRPTGDGKFTGSEDHPDGVSLILHYEVPVTPAIIAGQKGDKVNHAHVTLDDQRNFEKRLKDNEV